MTAKIKQTVWFVDLENVHSHWEHVLPLINEKDYVRLFYSRNADQISIPLIDSLHRKKVHLDSVLCDPGPKGSSALDFQLCLELGRMTEKYKKAISYRIVSNDTGFDAAVNYLTRQGFSAERIGGQTKMIKLKALYKQTCLELGISDAKATLCADAMYEAFSHKNQKILRLRKWMEVHLDKRLADALDKKALKICSEGNIP